MKKRLTITLSDSVLENLEKMAKELVLSKSGMISVALENYKKGQEKYKRATAMPLKSRYFLKVLYRMAKEKARYFTFLLYPDSIPEDWEMKLELLGLPMAISPLHDKDLSSVEGQLYKKAHYHVLYVAKNPVTADS